MTGGRLLTSAHFISSYVSLELHFWFILLMLTILFSRSVILFDYELSIVVYVLPQDAKLLLSCLSSVVCFASRAPFLVIASSKVPAFLPSYSMAAS